MLPSVSAGSAALSKYAQALAAAAPDQAARDGDNKPRADQEAARHNADQRPATPADDGALVRDARAAVEALLETLRFRVLTALTELGVPDPVASKAAEKAVVKLAAVLAASGQDAARIVHALLEKPSGLQADPSASLLLLTARDLTVIIDHQTGDIRVEIPKAEVREGPKGGAAATDSHLIDFTDRSPDQAAPALAALAAVHATARDVVDGRTAEASARADVPTGTLLVSSRLFATAAVDRLTELVRTGEARPGLQAAEVGAAVARVVAATVNSEAPDARAVPVTEIVASLSRLTPVAGQPDTGDAAASPRVFAHGNIAISADPQSGAVTVKVGQRITAVAPASLASPASAHAPLPGLAALPIPIVDIPASLPVGHVNDNAGGEPFVPPQIEELPLPGRPPAPAEAPAKSNASASQTAPLDEFVSIHGPGLMKNASVVHRLETAATPEGTRPTLVSLDLSAEIAPGMQSAAQSTPLGGFGLPRPAPAAAENGPVTPRGYTDAAANLIPVLPAWHERRLMHPDMPKPKPRKSPHGAYGNHVTDDAFDRETPEGHEGLVFSAVVFSV